MAEVLGGRLRALASANALVLRNIDSFTAGSEITDVVETVLKPYAHLSVSYEGPPLLLGEQGTSSVALILHELATNSAKYGSLATDSGTLAVNWRSDANQVQLEWVESGGSPISQEPRLAGFGSTLINNTIKLHGGKIEYHWMSAGLRVNITMDRERLEYQTTSPGTSEPTTKSTSS